MGRWGREYLNQEMAVLCQQNVLILEDASCVGVGGVGG